MQVSYVLLNYIKPCCSETFFTRFHFQTNPVLLFNCQLFFSYFYLAMIFQVQAITMYKPNFEERATEIHNTLVLLHNMKSKPSLSINALPHDIRPKAVIILVGPAACGATNLIRKIIRSDAHILHWIKLYTTKKAKGKENYYYLSKDMFNKMATDGEFLCIYEVNLKYNRI